MCGVFWDEVGGAVLCVYSLIKPSLPTHSCKVVPMKPSGVEEGTSLDHARLESFQFALNFHSSSACSKRAAWCWMNLWRRKCALVNFVLPLTGTSSSKKK